MPIYEYRRPDGSTFDVIQSFSDDPLTHDPDTGVEVQRVLHAPAVHFKGSGFYNTDYGTRRRQRESAAADGSAQDKSSGSDKGQAESAGATKSESGSGKAESTTGTKTETKADSKSKSAVGAS